jgi:Carboxypeptidase regulatory-like domain
MTRLVAFVVLAPTLLAQNYGAIEGIITDSISQTGVPGATVHVRAIDGRSAGYVGATGADGAFRIDNVLPGDYAASYSAPKYQAPNTEQDAYRPFHVVAGGSPVRLEVKLAPLGRVSARVVDEDGNPVARVQIMLTRLWGSGGSAGITEANGTIAFDGIESGSYLLLAQPVLAGTLLGETAERRSSLPPHPREGDRYQYAPTYYPEALARSEAEVIHVRGGSDLSGYVIRLRPAPVYRVNGVALDGEGEHVAKAVVGLWDRDQMNGAPVIQVSSGADGGFEFPSVAPGNWYLTADFDRNKVRLKGLAAITVGRRDVSDVSIRLSAPFTLTGIIERENKADTQGRRIATGLQVDGIYHNVGGNAFEDQSGKIRVNDLYPGRYRLRTLGLMPGFYVDAIWLGEANILGQEVDLSAGSPPIRIVYKANAARVRGSVENGADSAVYLIPQDEGLLDNLRSVPCDPAGRFEIGSVRPGDYYLLAFRHVEGAALTDPSFVRTIAPQAVQVHVEPGGIGMANLKVTPWPD